MKETKHLNKYETITAVFLYIDLSRRNTDNKGVALWLFYFDVSIKVPINTW